MPLNRVAKVDLMELKTRALGIIEDLRVKGLWDRDVVKRGGVA
jgi:hypothetical protein